MGNSSKDDSVADGETSSGDSQPPTPIVYAEGEKVLAFHGPHLYEAKARLSPSSFYISSFSFPFLLWLH